MSELISEGEFTDEQVKSIQIFLNKYCTNKTCISSVVVYNALKTKLGNFSKNRFYSTLSTEINNGIIDGFALRRGRNGGIHRKGVFDSHDENREQETNRSKRTYKKNIYKGACSDVAIESRQYRAHIGEAKIMMFILNVLEGSVDDSGNVSVGVMTFKVRHINILELFITSYCGVEKIQIEN